MIDIQDYLDEILEKSDGSEVITAIVGALSTIASDSKVVSQGIDISEELDIIEHNPNGNIVRKGISRALEKLSKYEKEDDTNILIDLEDFDALESKDEGRLYLIHNNSDSSLLAVDDKGNPKITVPACMAPIPYRSYKNLRNYLISDSYRPYTYRLTLSKHSIFDTVYPYQFKDLYNLSYVYALRDRLTISDYAFNDCHGLKYVEIGGNILDIGPKAFAGCENLNTIVIRMGEGSIQGAPWGAPSNPEIIWKP